MRGWNVVKQTFFIVFSTCLVAGVLRGGTPVMSASASRDPFWPVGFRPEDPHAPVQAEEPAAEPVQTPTERPITAEDWALARARIPRQNGIFQVLDTRTQTTVYKMNLLGRDYYVGDVLCVTNQNVAFTWKVDAISFQTMNFKLSPVSAEWVEAPGKASR